MPMNRRAMTIPYPVFANLDDRLQSTDRHRKARRIEEHSDGHEYLGGYRSDRIKGMVSSSGFSSLGTAEVFWPLPSRESGLLLSYVSSFLV